MLGNVSEFVLKQETVNQPASNKRYHVITSKRQTKVYSHYREKKKKTDNNQDCGLHLIRNYLVL